MTKVLYFDCFAGISGDMTLGALLDVGADLDYLRSELVKLDLGNFNITAGKTTKNGISCTDVEVDWPGKAKSSHHLSTSTSDSQHSHEEDIIPCHHCRQTPKPEPPEEVPVHLNTQHGHSAHRNLQEIEGLISRSSLNDRVKTLSQQIFQRLAQAEARVHGKSITEVHFHEVGAVDSIVDIVGTMVCLDYLGIERIYASPLHLGSGFLQCAHGTLPVEAPATMALLEGVPVYSTGIKHELVTPTGAAIITTLAQGYVPLPEMVVNRVGYGAGDSELEIPNLLRVILAEEIPSTLLMLETNIDDMNPQIYSHLFPLLLEAGALDVYLTPIIMKKNRPGAILSVLCPQPLTSRLEEIIFAETTTLGIRRVPVSRSSLQREIRQVETPWGQVRVKTALREGRVIRAAAEYEDCSRIAREQQIPLQVVLGVAGRAAEDAFLEPVASRLD